MPISTAEPGEITTTSASVVPRILVADDQADVREALRLLLKGEGYQTEAVTSIAGVFNALQKKDFALLMMDLNYTRDTTSGQEGLEVIPKIQEIDNTLPIVVMTAWATIDLAVEAMKRGARDFVPKPWDNERLLAIVRTQIELGSALRRGRTRVLANRHEIPVAGVGTGSANRAQRCERSHHRRAWNGQRGRCPHFAYAFRAFLTAHGDREYGWPARRYIRERIVWTREGRVHRRSQRSHRTL